MTHSSHAKHSHAAAAQAHSSASSSGSKQQPGNRRTEREIDQALQDTFPASDPPAVSGTTRIDPDRPADARTARDAKNDDKRR